MGARARTTDAHERLDRGAINLALALPFVPAQAGTQREIRCACTTLLNYPAGDPAPGFAGGIGLVVVLAGMDDYRRAVRIE